MSKVKLIIVGYGHRGHGFSLYTLDEPEKAQVVAAADPNPSRQKLIGQVLDLPQEAIFSDWREIVKKPKFADAVVITTQDRDHREPAIAFAKAGYHVLLEKPMASDIGSCKAIYNAIIENNTIFSVGHMMRYSRLYRKVKTLIEEGAIGNIVSINHMEGIGYWHFAHSYVRGNWRKEEESSFSLLAKSCHDIDLIVYLMNGAAVKKVSSFGGLNHFSKSKKPQEAGEAKRCTDCLFEKSCAYSAKKLYLDCVDKFYTGWPVSIICDNVTIENVTEALVSGPYGRCVYECDNDVADNQVVSIQFENNKTATFTMAAFSNVIGRNTRIFGTNGEIVCDDTSIRLFQFEGGSVKGERVSKLSVFEKFDYTKSRFQGHFGGNYYLTDCFVRAVSENNPSHILTGPEETLHSHLLVFAAEYARRTGKTVDFNDFINNTPDFLINEA